MKNTCQIRQQLYGDLSSEKLGLTFVNVYQPIMQLSEGKNWPVVSSMLSLQKDSALEDALSDCEGVGSELQYGDKAAHGSPLILVLTSSAASANDIAKKLPNLNRVEIVFAI